MKPKIDTWTNDESTQPYQSRSVELSPEFAVTLAFLADKASVSRRDYLHYLIDSAIRSKYGNEMANQLVEASKPKYSSDDSELEILGE